jgi:glycogen synthase
LGELDRAELDRLYRAAAVFVHPSRYEPFGLAPLEAASRGAALVLSDLASLREVWGDAALYFPPGDAESLREALERLCREPRLLRELAARAGARARSFGAAQMADRYREAYAELLARSREEGAPRRAAEVEA